MSEMGRPQLPGLSWILPGVVSLIGGLVVYTATQIIQVPQTSKSITDIAASMDHLRSDIQAASANTNTRIEALALQVGRSDISAQAVNDQLSQLRSKQDRADLADRDLDVRLAKAGVQIESLKNTLDTNAARSKEVDDRVIATMHALTERVDSLTRGTSRNAFESDPGPASPVQRPSYTIPVMPPPVVQDSACRSAGPTFANAGDLH